MIKYILLLLLLGASSCNYLVNDDHYEVNQSLDSHFFHGLIVASGLKEEALVKNYNSIHYDIGNHLDTSWQVFNAYMPKDTIFLVFNISYTQIKISVYKDEYIINAWYSTDIAKTFPDGETNGIFIEPGLKYSKLILNCDKFILGDTLRGYYELKTKPFRFKNNKDVDRFAGYFITILRREPPRIFR